MYKKIQQYWQNEKKNILFCFAATFILGLAAHAYIMFNNAMSHDWLNAFVATDVEEEWKIGLGRYIVPLYRTIFRNSIALPWLIGIISLFWFSLSTFLITKILDIRSRLITVLTAGIVVTNVTVIAQFATFLYEADFNAFSLFLAVAAAYIWKNHTKWYHLISSAILLFLSMGIYQSYVCVAVVLILTASILDLFNKKDVKAVIVRGFLSICVILLGFIIYYFVRLAVNAVTGIEPSARTNALQFLTGGYNPIIILYETVIYVIREILHPVYNNVLIRILFYTSIIITVISAISAIIKRKFSPLCFLIMLTLCGMLPFALGLIHIITYGFSRHDLMAFAVWFFWIIIPVFISQFTKTFKKKNFKYIINGTVTIFVLVIIWNNIVISNTVYMKRELVAQSSFSTMTRVLDRIEQHPDYIPGKTQVAFIGLPDDNGTESSYDKVEDFLQVNTITSVEINTIFVSDFILDYYYAHHPYFKYVLNSPIAFCDAKALEKAKKNDIVQSMPFFPAPDSVQMIDGVIVVKLGNIYF